jgi:predicted RNA-binding protein Jag
MRAPREDAEMRPPREDAEMRPPREDAEMRPRREDAEMRPRHEDEMRPRREESGPREGPRPYAPRERSRSREESRPYAPREESRPRVGAGEHLSGATALAEGGTLMSPDELAAAGKRVTEELFQKMGFEATVTARAEGDHVDVSAAVGEGEDLLTGRKGEVRQALQHLLNRMLNRGEGSRYHLQLEINEFWQHREEELRALAQRLAEEALSTNSEAVTEYLNAQERRIVHVTLREDTRVKTYALGTGLIKRVAVAPADFPEGPRSD